MSKLQLTINEHPIEDYVVADPITNPEFNGNYSELIKQYQEGEVTEIYAPCLINYIKWENMINLLDMFYLSLRRGGKLTLGGTSPFLLAKKLISRELSPVETNSIMFNAPAKVLNMIPVNDTRAAFIQYKYKIEAVNIEEGTCGYTITGVRQ